MEITSLRLLASPDPDYADCEAIVGKGTYIRALARDLASALGTCGHVATLRRLAVGPFTEANAIPLESAINKQHIRSVCGYLLPVEAALDGIPALTLTAADAERLRCGQRLALSDARLRAQAARVAVGAVVRACCGGALIALARVEDERLRPLRVMNW